jgi:hypothetical protein
MFWILDQTGRLARTYSKTTNWWNFLIKKKGTRTEKTIPKFFFKNQNPNHVPF